MEVMTLPVSNDNPDIVNSFPFPFAVWVLNDGTGNDVYGRFLYEETFLPAALRHP
jgi:hypothetical protein